MPERVHGDAHEIAPARVPEVGELLGRADDVREEDGCEHPVEIRLLTPRHRARNVSIDSSNCRWSPTHSDRSRAFEFVEARSGDPSARNFDSAHDGSW